MDDNFSEFGKLIISLKQNMFNLIKDNVDYIMKNNIEDKMQIERTLDYLLECCYNDESIKYYNSLCEYYGLIDKDGGLFYKKELEKYLDE